MIRENGPFIYSIRVSCIIYKDRRQRYAVMVIHNNGTLCVRLALPCIQDTQSTRARLALRPSARASKSILHTTRHCPPKDILEHLHLTSQRQHFLFKNLTVSIFKGLIRKSEAEDKVLVCKLFLSARALGLKAELGQA